MDPMNQHDNDVQDVLSRLDALAPGAGDTPRPAAEALRQLRRRAAAERRASFWSRLFAGRQTAARTAARRPALAWALLLVLFAASFAFPTVRAAASDFLGLFRVQKFAAISVSPEQIAVLQQLADSGVAPGALYVTEQPGNLTAVDTLPQAAAVAGIPTLKTAPALGAPADIYVSSGGSGRFEIDLENARTLMAAAGVDPALLPDTLQDSAVELTVYPGVEQRWANGVALLQTESPLVVYPPGVDPAPLGAALLQLLGMSPAEAARLARQIDWTSTLLLPVPTDVASFNEVNVGGGSGILLNGLDGRHQALIWQQQGMLYLLLSRDGAADLPALANTLQ